MNLQLSEIAQRTGGKLLGSDTVINKVSIDSRSLQAGETFVALVGPNFDGHKFLDAIVEAGASAAIVELAGFASLENESKDTHSRQDLPIPQVVVSNTYQALSEMAVLARDKYRGQLIAVTGSSGKTTVKGMLQSICAGVGETIATLKNLNNQIGVPLTLLRLQETTEFAVIEAGTSEPGEIPVLAKIIRPHVAIVNNVQGTHFEGFGSNEKIAEEKTALYSGLEIGGTAVINLDDPQAAYFISRAIHAKTVGFTLDADNPLVADVDQCLTVNNVQIDTAGLASFELAWQGKSHACCLQVPGKHNAANAAAAAAATLALDISVQQVVAGLENYSGEVRRMQIRKGKGSLTVIDDTYNASPASTKAAIDYLRQFEKNCLVFGDMGELGEQAGKKHREIGEYARMAGIQKIFTTGMLAAETAAAFGVGALWCETQSELLEKLDMQLEKQTHVLVKGSRFMRMDKIADALSQAGSEVAEGKTAYAETGN